MNPVFASIYLTLFALVVGVELYGVHRRSKRKKGTDGDTITEGWRWIDAHLSGALQWGWRVLTAGLLVWVLFHLPSGRPW